MSAHLLPCPSCKRHVRVSSDACPFCTFLLSDTFRTTPARPMPTRRLGRAATFAFGAALAGAAACGPHADAPPAPEIDQSGSGQAPPVVSAPPPAPPSEPSDPAYGAPPPMPTPTPPSDVAVPAYGGPPPMPPGPPPGPSGGAHSAATPQPGVRHEEDPGSMVALYGVPFDPQRIGGGDGVGSAGPRHGAAAPPPAPDAPRDPK